jgi:hypothetical protein
MKDTSIVKEYTSGVTMKALAIKYDVSPWVIRKILINNGIQRRTGGAVVNDLSGKRFGHVVVLKRAASRARKKGQGGPVTFWLCRCDCGAEKEIEAYPLSRGLSTTCGKCDRRANYTGVGELSGTYFSAIKANAKTRGIQFKLTASFLWHLFMAQDRCCALSGLPLNFAPVGKLAHTLRPKEQTASLDRIDSSKGYVVGNLQWVHKNLNYMKGELSDPEFFQLCQKVATGPLSKRFN